VQSVIAIEEVVGPEVVGSHRRLEESGNIHEAARSNSSASPQVREVCSRSLSQAGSGSTPVCTRMASGHRRHAGRCGFAGGVAPV